MQKINTGYIYAIIAFISWGILPAAIKNVDHINSLEMLAHRILWTLIFAIVAMKILKEFKHAIAYIKDVHTCILLFSSALLLNVNWAIYIWAINNNLILQTSLGYFINPIMNVLIASVFFKEKLKYNQWFAVFVIIFGIGFNIYHFSTFPWVAFSLAITFSFYAIVKKVMKTKAISGLFFDSFLVLPFVIIYLFYFSSIESSYLVTDDNKYSSTFYIALSGIIAVMALSFYSISLKKISFSKVGMLFYITPVCSFLVATIINKEPVLKSDLIIIASIIFSIVLFFLPFKRKKKIKILEH